MKQLLTTISILITTTCHAQNIDSLIQRKIDSSFAANKNTAYFSNDFIVKKISKNVDSVKLAASIVVDSLKTVIATQTATIKVLTDKSVTQDARLSTMEAILTRPQTFFIK